MDIGTLIRRAAREFGDRPAVRCGEQTLSFVEFDEQTERLANGFLAAGLRPGDAVSLLLPNGIELVVSYYALAKAGLVRVGLNFRDTEDDQRYKLEDSGSRALITTERFEHSVPMTFGPAELRDLIARSPATRCEVQTRPEDLLRIGYTGGTTGRSKGVRLTYGIEMALLRNYLVDLIPEVGPGDVMLHAAPLTHASGSFFLPHLVRGACNVLLARFEPGEYLHQLAEVDPTCVFLVPTMISMVIDHPQARPGMARSLRLLCYAASPIAPSVAKRAAELFGPVLNQTYGQAEAPMCITLLRPHEHDRVGSAGRPYTFAEVEIHDADGRPVPAGIEGEVVGRGDIVTPGYLNRPDETGQTLRGGWLHTGDIGRFDDDGFLFLLDRMNDVIISGGFNVYPRQVEDVLMSHPAVAECAVFGTADDRWGDIVRAAVTLKAPATEAGLLEFAHERLAGYRRPCSITILEQLPKSPAGKILRRQVRDALAAGFAARP
ncbi:MAG: AMP-binding protein [Burkholderiaceae bacterium]